MKPFAVSILAAYASWEAVTGVAVIWKMIVMTLVWIAAFATGTLAFWKVVERLAPKQP